MNVNEMLLKIIEDKHEELLKFKEKSGIFDKISHFEANAIGQIGEKFAKEMFKKCGLKMLEFGETIHDEFDIALENGVKIEIKTARKGLKNDTFQFNGINPHYNCDYILCLGLSVEKAYFKLISGAKIYNHKERKFYLKVDNKERQLVAMNPGNQANYKLTLSIKQLDTIDTLETKLKEVFGGI